MPASVENESEILLGNKQLLAVFAVVAILLAVAFTTGYMLGKNAAHGNSGSADATPAALTGAESGGGPITQKVTPDDSQPARAEAAPVETPAPAESLKAVPVPLKSTPRTPTAETEEHLLGSTRMAGAPRPGENYVQVTAVVRKVAEVTADVLRQHGFAARIAPTPGNAALFRVLVGPSKDAADLRNTEDKLRKIGYTKCFIQHY